jgi:hypothetical protein
MSAYCVLTHVDHEAYRLCQCLGYLYGWTYTTHNHSITMSSCDPKYASFLNNTCISWTDFKRQAQLQAHPIHGTLYNIIWWFGLNVLSPIHQSSSAPYRNVLDWWLLLDITTQRAWMHPYHLFHVVNLLYAIYTFPAHQSKVTFHSNQTIISSLVSSFFHQRPILDNLLIQMLETCGVLDVSLHLSHAPLVQLHI